MSDTSDEARALITQATAGVLSETAATIRALLARAEKAEQWNRDMVAKAASDGTLEGYRDLGRKCAQLEVRAEQAEAERDRLRAMNERLMAAVWMVGNMDTEHDKRAWWATFDPLWEEVAQEPRVQEWADRAALGETEHE
jgi:hypothetical protein